MQEKPGAPPVDQNSLPPKPQPTTEDPVIDKAVEDISKKESDEVLKAEDKELEKAFTAGPKTLKEKLKAFIKNWWDNPKARWSTIGGAVSLLLVLLIIPGTRYFMLNSMGARASASVTVVDETTKLPLKNVKVSIAQKSSTTNSEGIARLSSLKLGGGELTIEKRAFAPAKKKVVLGWGSNKLSQVPLKAIGAQYLLNVRDFLSAKPVAKAEASFSDASALSDGDGKILLTVDNSELNDDQNLTVSIKASTYRTEKVDVPVGSKDTTNVSLVPSRKEVFVSKRSGKFDLYKIDIDGKNEQLVLAGTGAERDDMSLVSHPSDELVAFVSTRDNIRNKDGYLLSSLDVINLADNSKFTIGQSEKIQIVGWQGDNLIFVQIAAGASATNPRRQRLVSYNSKTATRQELASSNYFNDIMLAQGAVYYAPSSAYQNDENARFYKINVDGSGRQTILEKEVFNIFRSDYDTMQLSSQDWYEYKIGTTATRKLSGQPANLTSRVYLDSASGKNSLWSDQRDGKGVLLNIDLGSKVDKKLYSQSGLGTPYRWLTDKIAIVRVKNAQETADYAINIDGGDAKKIKDVTYTSGIGQWYYY